MKQKKIMRLKDEVSEMLTLGEPQVQLLDWPILSSPLTVRYASPRRCSFLPLAGLYPDGMKPTRPPESREPYGAPVPRPGHPGSQPQHHRCGCFYSGLWPNDGFVPGEIPSGFHSSIGRRALEKSPARGNFRSGWEPHANPFFEFSIFLLVLAGTC